MWDRLTGNIEYFIKETKDLLFYQAMPPSAGLPGTKAVNDMSMRNNGFEVELGAKIHTTIVIIPVHGGEKKVAVCMIGILTNMQE